MHGIFGYEADREPPFQTGDVGMIPFIVGVTLSGKVARKVDGIVLAPLDDTVLAHLSAAPWQRSVSGPTTDPLPVDGFDYGKWYLQSLDGRLGKPRLILAPDAVPEGWGGPN